MKNILKIDIIMITIISFIGFCVEDIWMIFRHGILDNRNMYLPFLLGYGLLVVAIYYIFGTPRKVFNRIEIKKPLNYLVYFLVCFFVVSIGELLLGITVEKLLGYSYWNYSTIPLHITKYTSIPTSIGFALIITLFMNFIYEPIRIKISKIVNKIPVIVIILILIVLLIDFVLSFRTMYLNNGRNIVWLIRFR